MPAHKGKFLLNFGITFLISCYLVHPELCICLRNRVILTSIMSMPKAAIHKDAGPVLPHHDIWFPWQSWMIQTITEPMFPQVAAHYHLRFRVLAVDSSHVGVTLWGCMSIVHILSITTCSLQCSKNLSRVLQKPLHAALAMPNLAGCSRFCQLPTSNLMRIGKLASSTRFK